MSEYSQKSTRITNIYQLSNDFGNVDTLSKHAHWRKPVLTIPALASEFTDPENRPVFENIINEFRGASYLSDIIVGLDAATQQDVSLLHEIIADAGLHNVLIQWNDGPLQSCAGTR